MKISKEARIGISSIVILFVCYWGINFLKGSNILSRANTYYTTYSNVGGLEQSSPIMINGMKVGTVTDVILADINGEVEVRFTIDKKYKIPANSVAMLAGQSLLGGKGIVIKAGNANTFLESGDYMMSTIDNGMSDMASQIGDRAASLVDSLAITLEKINAVLSPQMIEDTHSTISNINKSTHTINQILDNEKAQISRITKNLSNITASINGILPAMNATMQSTAQITDSLSRALPKVLTGLENVVNDINGNGSIGLLLRDSSLYNNMSNTLESANLLLEDMKASPKRYVHFSLFGRKDKK